MTKLYSRASFTLAFAVLYLIKYGLQSHQIVSDNLRHITNFGLLTNCASIFLMLAILIWFRISRFINEHEDIILPASYILVALDGHLPQFYYFIITGIYAFMMVTERYVQGKFGPMKQYISLVYLKYNPLMNVVYRDSFFKEIPLAMKGTDFLFVNSDQIPKPWPKKYAGIKEDILISYIEKKVKCMEDVVVESI